MKEDRSSIRRRITAATSDAIVSTGLEATGCQYALRDGVKLADSGTLTGTDPARPLTADLTGARQGTLRVTYAGDGVAYGHAERAHPTLTCA